MLDLRRAGPAQPQPGAGHHPARAAGHSQFFDAQPRRRSCCAIPTAAAGSPGTSPRSGAQVRVGLRITGEDPCPLAVRRRDRGLPRQRSAPRAAGPRSATTSRSGAIDAPRASAPSCRSAARDRAQALLVAPVLIQRELRGRAIVVRESRRKFTRDDLEFLLVLVGQAAASLETVRLQAKAEEVAVLEERARIARDLHDGFIQALAGIDLRVEATQAAPAARSGARAEGARGSAHRGRQRLPRGAALPDGAAPGEPPGRPIWARRSIASPPSSRSASA